MRCTWQTGLLAPQPCEMPAAGGCGVCGRPVCAAHAVAGANGTACPRCASASDGYEENEETELESARTNYYTRYGGERYFTERDRESVEREGWEQYDELET